jgi:exopolysaccharide biosynthesis polyprenyl glycosylphosphotransferase
MVERSVASPFLPGCTKEFQLLSSATRVATSTSPSIAPPATIGESFRSGLAFYGLAARILDIVVILVALTFADVARTHIALGQSIPGHVGGLRPIIILIVLVIWVGASSQLELYRIDRSVHLSAQCIRAIVVAIAVAALFAGALYLTFRDVSRLLFVYFFAFSTLGLIGVRLLLTAIVRWAIPMEQRVAVIGTGPVARTIAHSLRRSRLGSIPRTRLVGFIRADEAEDESIWREPEPVLGEGSSPSLLTRRAAQHGVHEVILALPPQSSQRTTELVAMLREANIGVRMVPDVIELAATQARVETVGGIPMIYLRDPAIQAVEEAGKRSIDVSLSALLLAVCAPLMALIALGVRLDSPGPILYRAARVGKGGRIFTMYKFRTMHDGATTPATSETDQFGQPVYKVPSDPRVTRFGKLLRRTSMDELPQLLNVLRGDMSLVGPRPEQPFIVQSYQPWQRRRLEVRPGITGWWQVNGRDLPMHWHTDYDLYYIYNYSLTLDIKILARTLWTVIHGRGAY